MQDGRRQRSLDWVMFACKDSCSRVFRFKASGSSADSSNVFNQTRRTSLEMDPVLWIKAVQMSAQRFIDEVRWRIAERGYAYAYYSSLIKGDL